MITSERGAPLKAQIPSPRPKIADSLPTIRYFLLRVLSENKRLSAIFIIRQSVGHFYSKNMHSPIVRQIKIISNLDNFIRKYFFYKLSTKITFGFRFASSCNPFINPAVLKIIYCTFFAPVKNTIAGVFSCNVCSNSSPFSFFVYLHSPKIKFFSSFPIATISISLACLLAFPNLAQNQFAGGRYASKRIGSYVQKIVNPPLV